MPVLTQGNSATITFNDTDSITIQAGSGTATFECPVGNVVAVFSGTRTFGPYSNSTGRVTATVQSTYYETADGTGPVFPLQYQSGATPTLLAEGAAAVRNATALPLAAYQLCVAAPNASQKSVAGAQPGQAIYDATSQRTFVGFLGRDRSLYMTYYDHVQCSFAPPVFVASYSSPFEDDHGVPSIALDTAGYIHVIYGAHDNAPTYCKSTSPRDISAWTSRSLSEIPNGTYHSVTCDPGTGHLFVMYRSGTGHGGAYPAHRFATFARSIDGGATYVDNPFVTSPKAMVDLTSYTAGATEYDCYLQEFRAFAGRIYFAFNVAVRQSSGGVDHDDIRQDLVAGYIDPATGLAYTLAGALIGAQINSANIAPAKIRSTPFCYCSRMDIKSVNDIAFVWNEFQGTVVGSTVTPSGPVKLMAGHWNGVNVAVNELPVSGHHNFDQSNVRATETGWEFFLTAGRSDEASIFHPRTENIGYVNCGNDLWVVTSVNARSGFVATKLYNYDNFEGQGAHWITVPRNSQPGLRALISPGASQGGIQGGSSPQRLPLYALSADARAAYFAPPIAGACLQEVMRGGIVAGIDNPAFDSWQLNRDLSAWVPKGTRRAKLLLNLKGSGTAGDIIMRLRQTSQQGSGTTGNGQVLVSGRGEWANGILIPVWVPVSADRKFDYRWSGTAGLLARFEYFVIGFE